jgi:sulfur relay (sulfurtransferase) complex TusBCD TusD component (DsrE family)
MGTLTLIVQEAPDNPGNKAWHALRLAGAALVTDMKVRVFLLEQGVQLGRRGQQPQPDRPDLEALLKELIDSGLEVHGCGMCLDRCCLPAADLIPGIQRGSMKSLAEWISESDHVLTF